MQVKSALEAKGLLSSCANLPLTTQLSYVVAYNIKKLDSEMKPLFENIEKNEDILAFRALSAEEQKTTPLLEKVKKIEAELLETEIEVDFKKINGDWVRATEKSFSPEQLILLDKFGIFDLDNYEQ